MRKMNEYISREALIEEIEEEIEAESSFKNGEKLITKGLKIALKDVKKLPAADVQPVKRGTWENTNTPNQLRCSNCEIIHFIAQYPHGEINYCPNCGVRMDGGK